MRRGDLVLASAPGAYGKPRPHLVVQAEAVALAIDSVVLCPVTSDLRQAPFRVMVEPTPDTGLRLPSEVMADKPVTLPRDKLVQIIGSLRAADMERVDGALMLVLGLGARAARLSR